jgi:hypothetical protein
MNGLELFNKYTALRDFTESPEDEYAQLLFTLFLNIGDDLYPLLEKAETSGKKIEVANDVDFISADDLVIA